MNTALLELACEEKANAYMKAIATRLCAIEDALHDRNLSEQDRAAFIPELNVIRERFSSFGIEGADFDKQYTDNFKRVSHLAGPKDAYKLLVTLELAESEQDARAMSTAEISKLIQDAKNNPPSSFTRHLLKEIETFRQNHRLQSSTRDKYMLIGYNEEDGSEREDNRQFALRQLDYIFRNDITREKYDAYIDGLPIVTIPSQHFFVISQRINAVKQLAYEKPEADYEHVSAGAMQDTTATNAYEQTQRLAKAQPLNPESATTKAARQAQHVLDAIKKIEFKQKASDAAQAASDRMQAAGSAISSATASLFGAAQAAGVAAMAYMPVLSPNASNAKEVEPVVAQRPVTTIDHKAKEDLEAHVASTPAAQPIVAAPEAQRDLIDDKAPVVINAGPSIALAPEQPAQPVVIAQSGKTGDSTASLEAAAAAVSTISDSGASLAPAMPEEGAAPVIVGVAQPMARPAAVEQVPGGNMVPSHSGGWVPAA